MRKTVTSNIVTLSEELLVESSGQCSTGSQEPQFVRFRLIFTCSSIITVHITHAFYPVSSPQCKCRIVEMTKPGKMHCVVFIKTTGEQVKMR